jgi:hypothetical protein
MSHAAMKQPWSATRAGIAWRTMGRGPSGPAPCLVHGSVPIRPATCCQPKCRQARQRQQRRLRCVQNGAQEEVVLMVAVIGRRVMTVPT